MTENHKWDTRFLQLARTVAQWSKDPSTKVGAAITHGNRIVSLGYNGFAAGVNDDPARYQDRDFKMAGIIHAEENCLLYSRGSVQGCTIYTWPMPPCSNCAAKIIQAGIYRVVSIEPTAEQMDRWRRSFEIAEAMYQDAGTVTQWYVGEDLQEEFEC
jgi:dCMP deaminase